MRTRLFFVTAVVLALAATPAYGQTSPSITVDPSVVEVGGSTIVDGVDFDAGTIRIYVDDVDGVPLDERTHVGQFNFLVEISGVGPGAHTVIACNDQSRLGDCRQSASARLSVSPPPTTTTRPPPTTTTRPPPTTTTIRPTTTTRPATTTTRPAPTTTRPAPTTTRPSTVTTTTGAPTFTIAGTTTTPPTATIAPTTVADFAVASTFPSISTLAPVLAGSEPVGPDPTFDPEQDIGVLVTTTAVASDLASPQLVDWPDLEAVGFEVTQGIQDRQNRMPLVADRRTWVRLYVAADRLPDDTGTDVLSTGTGGTQWSYDGWEDVQGALWLQHGGSGEVLYPENGPVTAFGDTGDRLDPDSTLNFLLPDQFTADGTLTITAFVWSQVPGTVDTQESDSANNYDDITVEFNDGAEPVAYAVRLENDPVWDNVSVDAFEDAIELVKESMLLFHPVSHATIAPFLPTIGPGPEVSEDEDPDGLWDLDDRGWEPNIRMGWYHALWDLADDEWYIGVAPGNASSKWSGWANPGSHAFWTKGNNTTPAHEMGHSKGLQHVACRDTSDPIGVPDELLGGSIDPTYATAFPNCSLAPVDPDGYYGFRTWDPSPAVYDNDPSVLGAVFPFMSYAKPVWADPNHTCRLLVAYGVPCDPWQIGAPPLVDVVDFGQSDDLVTVTPQTGQWEPFLADTARTFDGPIALVHRSWGQPSANDSADDSPAVHYDITFNDLAMTSFGTGAVLDVPPEGARRLLVEQLTYSSPQPTDANADGSIDIADFNLWRRQIGPTAATSPLWARVSSSAGDAPGYVLPLLIDGLGHGSGATEHATEGLFAVPWNAAFDTIEFVAADGTVIATETASTPPEVELFAPEVDGRSISVSWTGIDPDGDSLLYTVSTSADGGASWRPVEVMTPLTSTVIGADMLVAGGNDVVVRVMATDGLATTTVESDPFFLANAAPVLSIDTTLSDVVQYSSARIAASAFDPEDGVIPDVVWSSDRDGALGAARGVSTRWLSVGVHTVTASVTDSEGLEAVDSVVIEVVDGGRARPFVGGDDPEVDRRLGVAAGVLVDSVSTATEAADDAVASSSTQGRASVPLSGSGGSGSSGVILGAGAAGAVALAAGVFARRRRSTSFTSE